MESPQQNPAVPQRKAKVHPRRMSPEALQKAIQENTKIYNDFFDIRFVEALNDHLFYLLEEVYFRPEFVGFDEMPARNVPEYPLIFASNHSGMAFPWDAMVFGCGFFKLQNYDLQHIFRPLVAPALSKVPFMHAFLFPDIWKVAGGIDATYLNFETMMHYPKGHLLIYPEGVPGIGKGFDKKYQFQRLSSSFIRMSLKYKTDIISYSTVNAEYIMPFMYTSKRVNRWFKKVGVPFMPLGPLTVFIFLQPWTFYLAFPVKMYFVRGSRIKPYEMTDKPFEALSEKEVYEIRDQVRDIMQKDLDAAVQKYGRQPYHWRDFFARLFSAWRDFPYTLPFAWPFIFAEFERQWYKKEGGKDGKPIKMYRGIGSVFVFIWRNPITLAYFIPVFGWVFLIFWGHRKWKRVRRDRLQKNKAQTPQTVLPEF